MNYKVFKERMLEEVQKQLGTGTEVSTERVLKNNDVMREALKIKFNGVGYSPLIYLKPLYEGYKNGETIDELVEVVIKSVKNGYLEYSEIAKYVQNKKWDKEKIVYKLISKENNKKLLKNVPWIPYLDLAIVFSFNFGMYRESQMTTMITNSIFESLEITKDELFEIAKKNTPRINPKTISSLAKVLFGFEDDKVVNVLNPTLPSLFILSNNTGINGATCMMYDGVLKDFANKMDSDLIIFPSSVHEVLLLPAPNIEYIENYKDMVMDINKNDVSKDEILSNSIYFYDRKEDKIEIL